MRSKGDVRRRSVVWVALAWLGVAVSVVASEVGAEHASAASLGTVTLTPASGSFSAPTEFTASAACPDSATRYKLTIVGGGVTEETNMTGNETFPEGVHQVTGIALSAGTFEEFANANGFTLTGIATVKVKCITGVATVMPDDFASTVTFTGSGAATQYTSGGTAASPTPSPTPGGATPTPTPVGGTPTPSPTATPEAGDPTPTPEPCADCEAETDDDSDDGTASEDDNGPLPGTGAQNPQQIVTIAALFALTGWLVLLFEAATRPREDWL